MACIRTPEEHLRSRSLDDAHVAELMKSFETFNSKSEVVEVLVICPPEGKSSPRKRTLFVPNGTTDSKSGATRSFAVTTLLPLSRAS